MTIQSKNSINSDIFNENISVHVGLFESLKQTFGYGIIAVTFGLQPLMKWGCDRLKGVWRIAAVDIFIFLSFLGTVNVWRGLWQLLDLHFMPGM